MEEFKAITTQEEFDERIRERLKRQEESISKKYEGFMSAGDVEKLKGDYDRQIADLNSAVKAAADKAATYDKDIADRDAKIKSYETSVLKTKIAHEVGIPYELAGRLSGESEEDLRKDAEGLSKLMNKSHEVPPMQSTEPGEISGTNDSLKKIVQSLRKE